MTTNSTFKFTDISQQNVPRFSFVCTLKYNTKDFHGQKIVYLFKIGCSNNDITHPTIFSGNVYGGELESSFSVSFYSSSSKITSSIKENHRKLPYTDVMGNCKPFHNPHEVRNYLIYPSKMYIFSLLLFLNYLYQLSKVFYSRTLTLRSFSNLI